MIKYFQKKIKMNFDKNPISIPQFKNINSQILNNFQKKNINQIKFENTYLKNLFSKNLDNPKKPQTTPKTNYSYVIPTPLNNPYLISISKSCCNFLELDCENISTNQDEKKEFEEIFSGNKIFSNSQPSAHCYVGHQFGVFAGQLGDGRAISIGDFYNSKNNLFELQLKGSGLTPYSRFADGRAVLRSSIREYLASEHLYALGIPTTRALAIIGSSTKVVRDPLYNGNVINETCCVVTRVAQTFMRFGSFEIFKDEDVLSGSAGPSVGLEGEMLDKMLDYVIKYHYKKIEFEKNENEKKKDYEKLIYAICERTALLSAYWQAYGFCHGVLNTDNMSIIGLTIDYGPYGFLEYFNNNFVPNHSDKYGRYAYSE